MVLRRTVLIVLVAASVAAARRLPPTVEIDGCVMPAAACPTPSDVITLRVGDGELRFGVERLSLPPSNASSAKILTELRLRGATVNGPEELTRRLVAGAHLRLRAALMSGPRLLLQSVEPRPEQ